MPNCSLLINGLELSVQLGWPVDERQQAQTVRVDITIHFSKPPKACESDRLDDTVNYDTLIEQIRSRTTGREFRLVEHLAADIYHCITQLLPDKSSVTVRLQKFPAIGGLDDGIIFSYGD